MQGKICCDSFIISLQLSCKCLYGGDAVAHQTLWTQTPIPLTGQQLWQIILPHQGMKYLQKLCFDHVFLLLSRAMLTCAFIASDGQQMGWSQAPSVHVSHHQCLSALEKNCTNHVHHRGKQAKCSLCHNQAISITKPTRRLVYHC